MKSLFFIFLFFSSFVYSRHQEYNMQDVYRHIMDRQLMIDVFSGYKTIDLLKKEIDSSVIDGDIAIFGHYRGGISIYMACAFPKKKLWISKTLIGIPRYKYNEKYNHVEEYFPEEYENNLINKIIYDFREFGLFAGKDFEVLLGDLDATTNPITTPIKSLALLKIDTDTQENIFLLLSNLYDKVNPGGFIVFENCSYFDVSQALLKFQKYKNLDIEKSLFTIELKPYGVDESQSLIYRKPKE